MARSLARGLDAAHRRGLAHLALRPSNVFVGPPPVCWTRTADFGSGAIDRALGLADRETLAFAAPELYAGQIGSLSSEAAARADVFSAALLCFFAAAGDTYWKCTRRKGNAAPGTAIGPLAQETATVRAPASVAAREIGVAWNPALDAAFARALSSAPAARFGSVGELADALADALELPRRGGAAGLADSLVKGERGPQQVRLDHDEGPERHVVAQAAASLAPRQDSSASVAPPPDSIAPTGAMTMGLYDAGPSTSPSPLVSAVPPPAPLPAFGATSGLYPLPPPHPAQQLAGPRPGQAAAHEGPLGPDHLPGGVAGAPSEANEAPRKSRAGLVALGIATLVGLGIGVGLALRAEEPAPAPAGSSARQAPPAPRERDAPVPPASDTAAPSVPSANAAPSASAAPSTNAVSDEAPSVGPTAAAPAPSGPIPTTYGGQPKPRVEMLDPPTTWFAELIVLCEPRCDVVLVQGGPSPNPEVPKQLPPGTYTVTVRQSGGIQSQASVLRAATRTTLTFDGNKALLPPGR